MPSIPRLLAFLSLFAFAAAGIAPASASAFTGADLAASIEAQLNLPTPGPGFVERIENSVEKDINVCSYAVSPGTAHCNARVRSDSVARATKAPQHNGIRPAGSYGISGGYDPTYLQAAYGIPANAGNGQTVA